MEKLLNAKDIAEMLGMSKYNVYQMCYAGKIPFLKLGKTNRTLRFSPQKINAWLSKQSHDTILHNRK